MDTLSKVLHPGRERDGEIFVRVNFKDGRLSLTGVVGPKHNGDCTGSAGQIIGGLEPADIQPSAGWTPESIARLWEVWDRWHLNDMRAGCEHQRTLDTGRKVEVVSYGLTTEALLARLDGEA